MSESNSPSLVGDSETILSVLKRVAKAAKNTGDGAQQLSFYQNSLAVAFGYPNWSVLHKNLASMSENKLAHIWAQMMSDPGVQDILVNTPHFVDAARDKMRAYVETRFARLIEFAFFDNESENGFDTRSQNLYVLLQEEFFDQIPEGLIEQVAEELEMEGPWGIEYY